MTQEWYDTGAHGPRIRAASALRELGHALVGHDVDETVLDEIATFAERTARSVVTGTSRHRPVEAMKAELWADPPPDGGTLRHFPDCVVSGPANPMGIAIDVRRDGDEVVAEVALGAAFEGAPGRAHGGVTAAVFDDVMGYVLQVHRTPAYTGRLEVTYRAPVPIGPPLVIRAGRVGRDGRKLWIQARMTTTDDQLLGEAQGLFITVDGAPRA